MMNVRDLDGRSESSHMDLASALAVFALSVVHRVAALGAMPLSFEAKVWLSKRECLPPALAFFFLCWLCLGSMVHKLILSLVGAFRVGSGRVRSPAFCVVWCRFRVLATVDRIFHSLETMSSGRWWRQTCPLADTVYGDVLGALLGSGSC